MTPFSAWSAVGAVPAARGWSEQALLSLLWGDHACPLQTRWQPLFEELTALGTQHVVATNQVAALGIAAPLRWMHPTNTGARIGTAGVDIDLDFRRIGAAFATGAPRAGTLQPSVRLFDTHGDALITFAQDARSPAEPFAAFVRRHARSARSPLPIAPVAPVPHRTTASDAVDRALQAWRSLSDPQGLETILAQHHVSRADLYRAAPDGTASPLAPQHIIEIIRWMVSRKDPMALQVGRTGVVAVARVIPEAVRTSPRGVEVTGSTAILRMDPRRMRHAWLVTTESERGTQRSIEFLDDAGELAVCLGSASHGPAAGVSGWTRAPFRPGA